jgi:hypothetical protein
MGMSHCDCCDQVAKATFYIFMLPYVRQLKGPATLGQVEKE